MIRMPSRLAAAGAVSVVVAVAGCGGGDKVRHGGAPPQDALRLGVTLTSPAFSPGATLPRRYTCAGEGSSPPVQWRGIPARSRELALLLEDPDAPGATFVHWVVTGVSPATRGFPAQTKPATLRLGRGSSGRVGYEPPCPPRGARAHRYVFTLYALRRPLGLPYGAPARQVQAALAGDTIARGRLLVRFGR